MKESKKKEPVRARKKAVKNNAYENIFQMVIVASMRAKELYIGEKPFIETNLSKPCLVALEEIKNNKISYKRVK